MLFKLFPGLLDGPDGDAEGDCMHHRIRIFLDLCREAGEELADPAIYVAQLQSAPDPWDVTADAADAAPPNPLADPEALLVMAAPFLE